MVNNNYIILRYTSEHNFRYYKFHCLESQTTLPQSFSRSPCQHDCFPRYLSTVIVQMRLLFSESYSAVVSNVR